MISFDKFKDQSDIRYTVIAEVNGEQVYADYYSSPDVAHKCVDMAEMAVETATQEQFTKEYENV